MCPQIRRICQSLFSVQWVVGGWREEDREGRRRRDGVKEREGGGIGESEWGRKSKIESEKR